MDAVFNFRVIVSLISCLLVLPASAMAKSDGLESFESNGYQFHIAPANSWVESNAYRLPTKKSHEPVSYLLLDHQVRFTPDNAEVYHRYVEQPNTTNGLEQVSTLEVVFNPAYQTLTWHAVDVYRNGKKIDHLDPANIKLLQREEDLGQAIVDGYVTSVLVVSGTRKGDVLDYSYSISGRNPIFGSHLFYGAQMGWEVSVNQLRKRFIFETEDNIHYQTYQLDAEPEVIRNDGQIEYKWNIKNTPPIFLENDLPSWYIAYPGVSFTSFDNWKEVVEWANPLYSNRTIGNAELLSFVATLQALDDEQKVLRLLEYVQSEIRYLGIEMGVNSHQPHAPDEVVENRYGDCKDKTLLLISLLALLDIPAYPALVSTYGGVEIDKALPAPNEFNHVITRVELGDRVYWLDPTQNPQTGQLNQLGYRNYDYALVIGHPSLTLTAMPTMPENLARIHTLESFNVISYEGAVDYSVNTQYSGVEAEYIRSLISKQGLATMGRNFLNYMTRLYPSLEQVKPMSVSDDRENNQLTLVETYRLNDFFRRKEQVLSAEFYAFSLVDYLTIPKTAKRHSPLKHTYPVKIIHETQVKYPEYFNMSLSNSIPVIETPHFTLKFTEDYRDQAIITKTEYESKSHFVRPSDVQAHIEALRRANSLISNSYETAYSKKDIPAFKTLASLIDRLNTHVSSIESRGESL